MVIVVNAVILAGGKASRMAGQDKGLVQFQNLNLITHALNRIAPQVEHLVINANRNLAAYQALGYEVIADENQDFMGPLAGILTALHHLDDNILLVVPCDCPWLPTDLVSRMQACMQAKQTDIVVASDGEQEQPVVLLLKVNVAQSIRDYLDAGERKLKTWYRSQHFSVCTFSDNPDAFMNINTHEQIARLSTEERPL
ncbi:molybdenum cofactor guanylyltransferase MobA [Shewanella sp. SR44-3]|uniref:molybdenum cofactor guanylyltransferase MobA n=1 Tax=Shewanella sp. SR44-3 TaxID=2760936 RepID=UPI0015F8C9D3|nr:molybdenum cofactor guanylyltransferase MobA [Shewanella sp. SR44-3]MBB1268435.1 molybdenum cofactor guanylyltransferase [Shewanella sp. SR44-3]